MSSVKLTDDVDEKSISMVYVAWEPQVIEFDLDWP
jgi:hypothetical protein